MYVYHSGTLHLDRAWQLVCGRNMQSNAGAPGVYAFPYIAQAVLHMSLLTGYIGKSQSLRRGHYKELRIDKTDRSAELGGLPQCIRQLRAHLQPGGNGTSRKLCKSPRADQASCCGRSTKLKRYQVRCRDRLAAKVMIPPHIN